MGNLKSQQASIIYNTSVNFVEGNRTLSKVTKTVNSVKRIVYPHTGSFYQVLSSDVKSKSGLNVSCVILLDRMVIFQVLKYMIEIWEGKIKIDKRKRKETGESNSGDIELPIILPLVVYHDKGEWTIKKTLGEMIPSYNELPDDLKKYIPNFEYLLFDLSKFPKEEMKLQSESKETDETRINGERNNRRRTKKG